MATSEESLGLNEPPKAALRRVLDLYAQPANPIYQMAVQRGISQENMQEFLSIFAQGLAWAQQQFPHQPGPEMVLFGSVGDTINYKGASHSVAGTRHAYNPSTGHSFLIVAYNDIREWTQAPAGEMLPFESHARQAALGSVTAREAMFLAGVEEYYHAVQEQNPEIKARIQAHSAGFSFDSRIDPHTATHDVSTKELDANLILRSALGHFRRSQAQRSI